MFDHDDFDRRFNRMQTFAMVWSAFVALLAITIIGVAIWAVVEIANDPASIGRTVGKIVNGYEETAQ